MYHTITKTEGSVQGRGNYTVRSHDCILIGGDFNFRCDVELQQVEDWLENGLWKQLLRFVLFNIA